MPVVLQYFGSHCDYTDEYVTAVMYGKIAAAFITYIQNFILNFIMCMNTLVTPVLFCQGARILYPLYNVRLL